MSSTKENPQYLEWNLHPSHDDSSIETTVPAFLFICPVASFHPSGQLLRFSLIGLQQQSVTPTRKSTAPVEVKTNQVIGRLS
jgi:hypothetical protein